MRGVLQRQQFVDDAICSVYACLIHLGPQFSPD
jgi:hypothetical protein